MAHHPFTRYAPFTDIAALKEYSARPLRKSLRVNTLKTTVEAFRQWAEREQWSIEPVPWCAEGFFVDRDDRSTALGKDLLHLLGCTYMQEAASMLPSVLLNPQPGETVLDMSAAPGSKTTQMAAMMRNTGVIVANDVQEKRLWTLKAALHRSGAVNVVVTKQNGQWFGGHMTERFDCVLCDAPCTAQGTARKDPAALDCCSPENIRIMARLQRQLLEAAVHAARVGGRIVYSTCTLTPEENESVVLSVLNKFCDQLMVSDPGEWQMNNGKWTMAIEDSLRVQQLLEQEQQFAICHLPFLRLWPQTYDTEGFFCAVLEKRASTCQPEAHKPERLQERPLARAEQRRVSEAVGSMFGTDFLQEGERLSERGDQLVLSSARVAELALPTRDYTLGLPYAKRVRDGYRITHELATARGGMAASQVLEVEQDDVNALIAGKDTVCDASLHGDVILRWNGSRDCPCRWRGLHIGLALAKNGVLKNRLSRWVVRHAT